MEEPYIASVIREIDLWKSLPVDGLLKTGLIADSIYFGGGTPSLLKPEGIGRIIGACASHFQVSASPEITLEINPSTVTRRDLNELRAAGVNRASLGVQSFNEEELRFLGRSHSARDARVAFDDLRAARFDNISVDLIAGFPGQTRASLLKTLRAAIGMQPEHISVYLLELKEGTSFYRLVRSGELSEPDDDLAAQMYEDIRSRTVAAGYEHYEISNFALQGRRCSHNLKYWEDKPFLGTGPGAHGMTGRHRYANLEDFNSYVRAVGEGKLPQATLSRLTPMTRFQDAMIMGMRLVRGVSLNEMARRYGMDTLAFVSETVPDLFDAGLVRLEGDVLSLTERGHLLSNIVFSRWV